MFGIGVDDLGKLIGGAAGACLVALLTWLGTKKNMVDAAEGRAQPAAMGIVLDGDTATGILAELRAMRADQQRWRGEDLARADKDKIESLQGQLDTLRQGQAKTHGNQVGIGDRLDTTEETLRQILSKLDMH